MPVTDCDVTFVSDRISCVATLCVPDEIRTADCPPVCIMERGDTGFELFDDSYRSAVMRPQAQNKLVIQMAMEHRIVRRRHR
jgi:hypothetical protein